MKKRFTLLLALSSLVLIGCGGGGGSSSNGGGTNSDGTAKDSFKIQKVGYSLNGSNLPSCDNPSSIVTSKAREKNRIGIHRCSWFCGDYEGAKPVMVTLTFMQDGKDSVWEFDSDIVSTAPQQCHN